MSPSWLFSAAFAEGNRKKFNTHLVKKVYFCSENITFLKGVFTPQYFSTNKVSYRFKKIECMKRLKLIHETFLAL